MERAESEIRLLWLGFSKACRELIDPLLWEVYIGPDKGDFEGWEPLGW